MVAAGYGYANGCMGKACLDYLQFKYRIHRMQRRNSPSLSLVFDKGRMYHSLPYRAGWAVLLLLHPHPTMSPPPLSARRSKIHSSSGVADTIPTPSLNPIARPPGRFVSQPTTHLHHNSYHISIGIRSTSCQVEVAEKAAILPF